jgi:hypothetical protein
MSKKMFLLIAAAISLLFVSVLWQAAEANIYALVEKTTANIIGRPFNQTPTRDAAGIPMQIYSTGETHYNPLFIASEAQEANLQRRLGGSPERFILLTDWLLDNVTVMDSIALMQYTFPYPKYKQEVPWSSALTQAFSMNALAMRAGMERNLETLAIAEKMLHSLRPGYAGLSHAIADSIIWFMEYPAQTPYYALSGMMNTLLELHAYHDLTRDPLALDLFNAGFNALLLKLPEFDYHGYSYYDLSGNKAGRGYHQRHIKLLNKLMDVKRDSTLLHYRNRWQRADSYPVVWQMLFNPRPKRVAAFSLSFLALTALLYLLLVWTQRSGKSDPEHS